ncbi:hypothetical protein DIPPA_25661 [Diplonema papillatum]|nr:hypothetical protein DIPPA_25661 [Diplonema papillatum]
MPFSHREPPTTLVTGAGLVDEVPLEAADLGLNDNEAVRVLKLALKRRAEPADVLAKVSDILANYKALKLDVGRAAAVADQRAGDTDTALKLARAVREELEMERRGAKAERNKWVRQLAAIREEAKRTFTRLAGALDESQRAADEAQADADQLRHELSELDRYHDGASSVSVNTPKAQRVSRPVQSRLRLLATAVVDAHEIVEERLAGAMQIERLMREADAKCSQAEEELQSLKAIVDVSHENAKQALDEAKRQIARDRAAQQRMVVFLDRQLEKQVGVFDQYAFAHMHPDIATAADAIRPGADYETKRLREDVQAFVSMISLRA